MRLQSRIQKLEQQVRPSGPVFAVMDTADWRRYESPDTPEQERQRIAALYGFPCGIERGAGLQVIAIGGTAVSSALRKLHSRN